MSRIWWLSRIKIVNGNRWSGNRCSVQVVSEQVISDNMKNNPTQKEKAIELKKLHHGDDILVLPNIWDPLGAALLESLGYPAIATASASVALTSG